MVTNFKWGTFDSSAYNSCEDHIFANVMTFEASSMKVPIRDDKEVKIPGRSVPFTICTNNYKNIPMRFEMLVRGKAIYGDVESASVCAKNTVAAIICDLDSQESGFLKFSKDRTKKDSYTKAKLTGITVSQEDESESVFKITVDFERIPQVYLTDQPTLEFGQTVFGFKNDTIFPCYPMFDNILINSNYFSIEISSDGEESSLVQSIEYSRIFSFRFDAETMSFKKTNLNTKKTKIARVNSINGDWSFKPGKSYMITTSGIKSGVLYARRWKPWFTA